MRIPATIAIAAIVSLCATAHAAQQCAKEDGDAYPYLPKKGEPRPEPVFRIKAGDCLELGSQYWGWVSVTLESASGWAPASIFSDLPKPPSDKDMQSATPSSPPISTSKRKPNLITSKAKFTNNGTVLTKDLGGSGYEQESGEIDGYIYSFYYTDGSGTFQGAQPETVDPASAGRLTGTFERIERDKVMWHTTCEKDIMTDSRYCMAYRGDFWITYTKGVGYRISIGTEHYPGSRVAVRVDGNKPITAPEDSQFGASKSKQILSQIKEGSKVAFRFQKWPYQSDIDKVVTFNNTQTVLRYLKWAVDNMR